MLFEWAIARLRKISLSTAYLSNTARMFLDPHRLDSEDTRCDCSEERRLTLGKIEGRLFAVAYTARGKVIRLISARKANEREGREYDETLST